MTRAQLGRLTWWAAALALVVVSSSGALAQSQSGGGGGSAAETVEILDRVTADTGPSEAQGDTETALYTKSIAGGTLSTNKRVRLTIAGFINGSGVAAGTRNYQLRVKYGATTLVTQAAVAISSSTPTSISSKGFRLVVELSARGATNAQFGLLTLAGWVADASGGLGLAETLQGTATEDSTAAKTLQVTAQFSGAGTGGTYSVVAKHAVLEKL